MSGQLVDSPISTGMPSSYQQYVAVDQGRNRPTNMNRVAGIEIVVSPKGLIRRVLAASPTNVNRTDNTEITSAK